MHTFIYIAHLVTAIVSATAIFWLARHRALPGGGLASPTMPIWGASLIVTGVILFEVTSLNLSSPPTFFWDFLKAYYPAGVAALRNDPGALKALISIGAEGGFVNIPAAAYLFAPFGWLSPQLAATLFTIVGVGSAFSAWFLLVRLAKLELLEQWLLAFLFFVNGPLLNGIKFGNISYFLICILAVGLRLLRTRRSAAAGVVLGAAAVLKPPLALFGLFFLLRRDVPGVLGFALVGVATVVVSIVLFGWIDNLYWFQASILQYSLNCLAGSGVQSIPAFLFRLHEPPEILLDWSSKVPGAGEKVLARAITGSIFLIAACASLRPRARAPADRQADEGERRDLQYLLTLSLCVVCSPLSWAHYYAWLLIPTAFFLGARPPLSFPKPARVVGWIAIALVTPLVFWPRSTPHSALMAIYASFVASHYLFGGLLWFGLIAWWLARTGGLLSQGTHTAQADLSRQ